jgi:hypothetical protein
LPAGDIGILAKKRVPHMNLNHVAMQKNGPAVWRGLIARKSSLADAIVRRGQRPKNSHNRIITGIGTPNNQSRIPRPMFASINSSTVKENAEAKVRFP